MHFKAVVIFLVWCILRLFVSTFSVNAYQDMGLGVDTLMSLFEEIHLI